MRDYPLSEIILPMGGNTQKNEAKMGALWDNHDYIAEEKFDGSRYLSVEGRFFSRVISVKDGYPVEKTDNVPHLANHLARFPGLILDGEVYRPGATSNEVTSIMGAKPELAIERQQEQGNLIYVVYDILMFNGEWVTDRTWIERRALLETAFLLVSNDYMKLSQPIYEGKKKFLEEVLERGGEGVMLKNIKGKYIPGKKPANNWVKVKTEIDDDVIITGFKDAVREYVPLREELIETWRYWEAEDGHMYELTGKFHADRMMADSGILLEPVTKYHFMGWIGAIKFGKFDAEGNLVELGECSGITEELRADMSTNQDKYIGQVMEIKAMQKTRDGFYRHPQYSRMRPDKNDYECVIEE